MTVVHAAEVNYVILTAEQFATDYPQSVAVTGRAPEGPVLVLTDDEGGIIAQVEGNNKAMLAELTGDIAEYAKAEADPGEVVAAVGRSETVLADATD